ncbi:phospholipase D [Thelephora ganbajun]|uniref:Phospholipase D n=1 Tax=Thelephora ganbajun TaxID=370292 RepID=A0ACB6ZSK9_THEGA|nr:phospholipase D [Thelephora ganbajun]
MASLIKKIASTVDRLPEGIQRAQGVIEEIASTVDRLPEGIQRAQATIEGLVNPDRRHNGEREKEDDRVREEIKASHRFRSFANERAENAVKWHVDGHDYLWALSEVLDNAREVIFIMDWWLSPELYLRRPCELYENYRLDRVLKRKAEAGVRVYIIVYKEVTQTMNMSSSWTKHALEPLHPSIAVMRHPDHIGSQDSVQFWSHHEKVVVVDNHVAAIGGIDLCFGRWDTHSHPLADVHPTGFKRTLFPGQDYNNARVMDFKHVKDYVAGTVSILETPRMPWHDTHMTFVGPCVLDVVQHFVERWNEIKKRKYVNDDHYEWLALPHNIVASPTEAVVRHPHREAWHTMGRRFKQRFHIDGRGEDLDSVYGRGPYGTCRVQVVRSVCDWSHGVLKEDSIQNAYCQLIREANHYIYIENQFFISNTKKEGPVQNLIAQALVERIIRAARGNEKFKVVVLIPEVPGFSGDIKDETAIKTILAGQYRTINRGGNSIYEEIKKGGYEPMDFIRFYHLRAYDRLNAPYGECYEVELRSGVSFYEAQVAQAREWIGNDRQGDSIRELKIFEVKGNVGSGLQLEGEAKKNDAKVKTLPLPQDRQQAKRIVDRFENVAQGVLGNFRVSDNVGHHAMKGSGSLLEERWSGTEDEERNWHVHSYVSEVLYIHSKLMIVDDRRVIMGSANINDRSQKGDGDSEIALVVEDNQILQTTMNGRPYAAAKFAATLRRRLYREHLGLLEPQHCAHETRRVTNFMKPAPYPIEDESYLEEDRAVADPLADETISLWENTARKNREIFTELFRPVPTNLVRSMSAYKGYLPDVKQGHVVPDMPLQRVKDRLAEVRGHVVEAPIDFLIDDKEFVGGIEWSGFNPTLPIYI